MAAGRTASIAVIVACQVAAMTLWFSATAIIPVLQAERGLDSTTASLFTSAVQFGFVDGELSTDLRRDPTRRVWHMAEQGRCRGGRAQQLERGALGAGFAHASGSGSA